MSLREAKRVKIGEKVVVKKTGMILTVSNKTFVRAGIGYPQDAIQFEFEEIKEKIFHSALKAVAIKM